MASTVIVRNDGVAAGSARAAGAWGLKVVENNLAATARTPAEEPAAGGENVGTRLLRAGIPSQFWTVLAMVIVWQTYNWAVRHNAGAAPELGALKEGIGPFALLYIAAQAIERLLEPVSGLLGFKKTAAAKAEEKATEAAAAATKEAANEPAGEAAAAQDRVDRITQMRAMLLWAAATALGFWVSAVQGVYLLALVLETGPARDLDILVTGLAIGGGTKPLHDLISKLQKSSAQDSAAPGTKPGAK